MSNKADIFFFLIKPTRRKNFPNLFCQKALHVSGISLPIIRSFLLYIRYWYIPCSFDDSFHPEPAWKLSSKLQEIYQCRIYSRKILLMGKGNARNM